MTAIQDFQPDDEDDNWISLDCSAEETSSSSSTHARLEGMSSPTEKLKPLQTYSTSSSQNEDTCATLIEIREKHQTQYHLKSKYLNRPLSRFPGLFLFHLMQELWHYNLSMRLGKITRREHNQL